MALLRVYRIYSAGREPHDAMGARIAGGRWNPRGMLCLYTSTHLSLACLEKLVHLPRGSAPVNLRYGWTEIPEPHRSLDPARRFLRDRNSTEEIGKQWLLHQHELSAKVPSVVIPGEDNIILNPLHEEYDSLYWETDDFEMDPRLV